MRAIAALTVFVYLVPSCLAEDWTQLHGKGTDAVKNRDFAAAADLFERSQGLAQTPVQRAVSANDLGIVLYQTGRQAEAGKWLQAAIDIWKTDPANRRQVSETSLALAEVDRMLGNYSAAESILRSLIPQRELTGNLRGRMLTSLGDMMREEGNFTESRRLLTEAGEVPGISWKRRLEGLVVAAQLDLDASNWDASVDEWNQAAALAREKEEPGMEAVCLHGLGRTWLDRGNLARAEPLLKRALAMYENGPAVDETMIATVLSGLGGLYLAEEKGSMAEDALGHALSIDERCLGPSHPQVAVVLEALAAAVATRNRMELARAYLDRAERIMSGTFGGNSVMTVGVLASWGAIEQRAGQPDRAVLQYRKALDVLRDASADLDPLKIKVLRKYAEVLKATHHEHEAKDVMVQVRNFRAR